MATMRRPEGAPARPDTGVGGGRGPLVLVLVVFLGPLLAAALAYWQADAWVARGGSHHGELIDPARPLGEITLRTAGGEELGASDLTGKWHVVYVGSAGCGETCRQALYRMRQAHKAQGRDIGRVRRLFLARTALPTGATRRFLNQSHPHLTVARPRGGGEGLAAFRVAGARGMAEPGGIYVVDPNGNLVLRYSPTAPARGLLEDLQTLLKHSTIG